MGTTGWQQRLSITYHNLKPTPKLPVAFYRQQDQLNVWSGRQMTMTKSNLGNQTPLSTLRQLPGKPHKKSQKYLMNEKQCKMQIVNKENDDEEMANHAMTSSSTTPTCSPACLAVKLKKLMKMEATQVPMMIETKISAMERDDPKKCTRAQTLLAGAKSTAATSTQI